MTRGPQKKLLDIGGNPDLHTDPGIFFNGERETLLASITKHAMRWRQYTLHSMWQATQKGLMPIKLAAFKKGKVKKQKKMQTQTSKVHIHSYAEQQQSSSVLSQYYHQYFGIFLPLLPTTILRIDGCVYRIQTRRSTACITCCRLQVGWFTYEHPWWRFAHSECFYSSCLFFSASVRGEQKILNGDRL